MPGGLQPQAGVATSDDVSLPDAGGLTNQERQLSVLLCCQSKHNHLVCAINVAGDVSSKKGTSVPFGRDDLEGLGTAEYFLALQTVHFPESPVTFFYRSMSNV